MSSGFVSTNRPGKSNHIIEPAFVEQPGANHDDNDSLVSDRLSHDEDDEENEEYDGHDENNVFRGSLKMPPFEHAKRTLSQLIDLMNGPYLDLAPHYQRGVVWTRKAMRLLIDSMWKGYYIPPVIFNLELTEDANGVLRFKRTCVDGKQRLTSIRDFMNGEFPCWINKKPWYFRAPKSKAGRSHKVNVLPDSAREEFKAIEILCTEYKGLSERQEIELFQRVQLGKPLTKAEAFRATQGSWQEFAKLYEHDFASVVNLCKQARASGFRTILVCFLQIYECVDPAAADGIPILRNSFKSIESFCSNAPSLDADTKSHLRFVFELFRDLVEDYPSIFENNNYSKRQTFSPLELIAVACLISQKGAARPKGMLRGDILALRAHLREAHSDIRLSKPCWTTAWRFIDTIEYHRGAIDGSTTLRQAPKIIKKKPASQRSQQPSSTTNPGPHAAPTNQSSITNRSEMRPAAMNVIEELARAASRITPTTNKRQNARSLNLLNCPPTNAVHNTFRNSEARYASATSSSDTGSGAPYMSSIANHDRSMTEPRQPSESPPSKSIMSMSRKDHPSPQRLIKSGSRTPQTPSAMSPTFADITGQATMTAPPARKRVALDLGGGNSGIQELESKKARLMAGYVKQEKDI